jgi:dihydrofolate synthase/folylpolyglutamate synthase
VEDARGDVPLTYFEYGTLAAFHAFAHAGLDVAILEVGLGGRLDAVNVVAADVAVVTSIALDHMDYLGPTRADIAYEKAGIFRAGRPVVCADPIPASLTEHAAPGGR